MGGAQKVKILFRKLCLSITLLLRTEAYHDIICSIMRDTAREELIEAEKTFMEEEMKKLQKKFLKEKKELKARFVAERQANYCMVAEAGLEA